MAEVKETKMRLKVDLQCCKCYKKVKRVLCKFPQIRDQDFEEKQGIVTIKVVCCDPEKLRDKLCCKGEGCIKSIEIEEPPKPKPKPDPKPAPPSVKTPKPVPKATTQQQKEPKQAPPPAVSEPVLPPRGVCCGPCSEGRPGGPCYEGYGRPPTVPFWVCCGPCYQGYSRPPICYDGYYGWPVCDSYGGGRPCYMSCCEGCTVM